jgi:hypothetical protein
MEVGASGFDAVPSPSRYKTESAHKAGGIDLASTPVSDVLKACFVTTDVDDNQVIYHLLQGGSSTNTKGTDVYIGFDKATCNNKTYKAPYTYAVERNRGI